MKKAPLGGMLAAALVLIHEPAAAHAPWVSPEAFVPRYVTDSSRPVADWLAPPVAGQGALVKLAHAILVKAQPDKEATITDIPEEITLIFNDAVGEEFLALAVVDESGKRVDKHDAKLDFTDHSHLRASVEKLNPGRYMVRYRVLSADGHVVSGKYFFQVQGK